MENKKKIYAFIDSQNINMGVFAKRWNMDWGKFREYLRNTFGVEKAYLFIGYIDTNEDLYKRLEKEGFIVIYKKVLAVTKDEVTTYKGNVDAEMVLHTMIEYPNYDSAIICTGDGDFLCLIEYLEKNNKLEKIIAANKRFSTLLQGYSKYILDLYSLKKELGYMRKGKKKEQQNGKTALNKEITATPHPQ